mgnify:CR=1 FL=1
MRVYIFTSYNMYRCLATNCNSSTHTTKGHRCTKCGELGHSIFECENVIACQILSKVDTILPESEWCTIENCDHKQTHRTHDHTCNECGLSNHNIVGECPIKTELTSTFYSFNANTLTNEPINLLSLKDYYRFYDDFYVKCESDNNTLTYIRKKNGIYRYLIVINGNTTNEEIHDLVSRFTYKMSYMYFSNMFLENIVTPVNTTPSLGIIEDANIVFDNIINTDYLANDYLPNDLYEDTTPTVNCPLCRTEHKINQLFDIKGSEETCKVCYENNVEKFYSLCGHGCVCKTCFDLL